MIKFKARVVSDKREINGKRVKIFRVQEKYQGTWTTWPGSFDSRSQAYEAIEYERVQRSAGW